MGRIKSFLKDERGAAAVEYGLLVGLIAVVVVVVLTTLGQKVKNVFSAVGNAMPF